MVSKVAIIYYSMYGHVGQLARAIKKGVESVGLKGDLYQIPETLPKDVLEKMHAPGQDPNVPLATMETMEEYEAFLFGMPTRYGNQSAQVRAFWDRTGQLWVKGSLHQKLAGVFFSTASVGGGQEMTAANFISTLAHHGMVYVPLGYFNTFSQFTSLTEVRGGSAWGSGTLAGGDGSRQPSKVELELAEIQGKTFAELAKRVQPKAEDK
ncbi:NAD(P)H dehydrogenase (quinone) [Spizellomyces sp. 'palustris']|nr:NAD(P)H dehydrogenase (quinone) [Spizellomyces sp. 'palustris']